MYKSTCSLPVQKLDRGHACVPRHQSSRPSAPCSRQPASRRRTRCCCVFPLRRRGAYRNAALSALARGGSRATRVHRLCRLGRATARSLSRRARALPDAARCVSQCGAQRVTRASYGGARPRACGWQAAPLPVVALTPTPPWTFCQALGADLLTARGVLGGVGFKAPRAPTLPVRLLLAVYAFAACANPNLSLRRVCATFRRRRRLRLMPPPSWRSWSRSAFARRCRASCARIARSCSTRWTASPSL